MPALASLNDVYRVHASTQDIIKRALRLLGVLASGEPLPADQLTDGLESFNDMVDSWNTEKLTIPVLARNTFTLTVGTNPYDIGPGLAAPDFDAPRPNRIEKGQAWLSGAGLGESERGLDSYSREQWAAVYLSTQVGMPRGLYYEPSSPDGRIWFELQPDATYSLILFLEQLLEIITLDGITTELVLRPGYKEALTTNLAIEIAPEYGKSAPAEVINQAIESKAWIKRMNQQPLTLNGDVALTHQSGWDIFRGPYG